MTDDDLGALMRHAAGGAGAAPTSPEVARQRATRRQRRRMAAGGVGLAALAVVVSGVVLTGDGPDREVLTPAAPATSSPPPTVPPSPAASPSGSASASPSPSPSPSAAPPPPSPSTAPASPTATSPARPTRPELRLNGDDLGVTRVGASYEDAVEAISAVLGPPLGNPSGTTFCISADFDVEWAELQLGIEDGRVTGWSSGDPSLEAPSGVRVGTTVDTLKRVYGDRLQLHPFNPDAGHSFSVEGVDFQGGLSGPGDEDRVGYLWNGACGPP